MKLADLYQAKPSLDKFLNKDLPVKLSFKLRKFVAKAGDELKFVELEREKLVNKHGKTDGEQVKVPQENIAKFVADFNAVLETEVELPFEGISVAEVGDIELSPVDCDLLAKICVLKE